MRIVVVGGGPGGLYTALLIKRRMPTVKVALYERNRADDTFGFGVVFSDQTMGNMLSADPETMTEIREKFSYWQDIDIHVKGEKISSTGHGFSGLGRLELLQILQTRCESLGVELYFQHEVEELELLGEADLIVAADGVNSSIRTKYAEHFRPEIVHNSNRFVWLGSTRQFDAFNFFFKENEHGLWRVHAYQYAEDRSTFIVETTEETLERAGMLQAGEAETAAFCGALFEDELAGHPLITNRSVWRQFPTIKNRCWHHKNIVLLGDAVHTAHFSIGSGTKLAMEDAISLVDGLSTEETVQKAISSFEERRRPEVESLQRAAQISLEWFEDAERYYKNLGAVQFGMSLLTRSLRITHENLKVRDPAYVENVDRVFAVKAFEEIGEEPPEVVPPPMFTPYQLRGMRLENRVVVSPMCQYCAVEGTPNDWHLVHLGSRAIGGAGLIITEMTHISREARITPGCTGLYNEEHVAAWKRITDFIHSESFAKVGVQLGHAGRKGSTKKMWEGMDEPLEQDNWPLLSASSLPYLPHSQVPDTMTEADMEQVISDFVQATTRADEAGFDLLEIHMAHGYLLASFISPVTNKRTDSWGGELEGRMRFPLQVFDAVRAAWPKEKPISARISATDWITGGTTGYESVKIASMLKARGCDIIDVSTGQTSPEQSPRLGRLYQTPHSERIRLEALVPTMTVGGVSSFEDVNSILTAGRADLCLLARAHLYDPYWTRHAAYELGYELPWPPQYEIVGKGYSFRFK